MIGKTPPSSGVNTGGVSIHKCAMCVVIGLYDGVKAGMSNFEVGKMADYIKSVGY
eukprot:COSAG01_NODE_11489_length_1923_cov_1.561952_2_plen_55_part_00